MNLLIVALCHEKYKHLCILGQRKLFDWLVSLTFDWAVWLWICCVRISGNDGVTGMTGGFGTLPDSLFIVSVVKIMYSLLYLNKFSVISMADVNTLVWRGATQQVLPYIALNKVKVSLVDGLVATVTRAMIRYRWVYARKT